MDFSAVRQGILGEGVVLQTPYGSRRLTYSDYAATGRACALVEDFLRTVALPMLGNTHSETSAVAAQTSAFREEARQIIKSACGCADEDVCIFAGNGVTGAIQTLIRCIGTDTPMVVFLGPFEHHSAILPWQDQCLNAEVITIADCDTDGISLDDLQAQLAQQDGSKRLIGCFSAGSNVTGRLSNVQALAKCMHDAGGVAFFDYAAAGPYVPIDMNGDALGYADAIFLSMHKFVGGPGSPGILLAKKHLFDNDVPAVPGGGTVSYVSADKHTYLQDIEHREEGGTPNLPGSLCAGLAMQLKQTVGADVILAHEQNFAARAIAAWSQVPGVTVLGNTNVPRLGILSFLVASPLPGKLLHHNFVVALLNDLFGIQARGGNSCAAPYAHALLGISDDFEAQIEACVAAGWHGCKPGWSRVSFAWYDSDDTLAYVVNAVSFIATYGYLFLCDYDFNPKSGTWTNHAAAGPLLSFQSPIVAAPTLPESVRPGYLQAALALAQRPRVPQTVQPTPFEDIRWFVLPGEV